MTFENKQGFGWQVILLIFTVALIAYGVVAAFNFSQRILPDNHIGYALGALFALIPFLTVLSLSIVTYSMKTQNIYSLIIGSVALVFFISAEWGIHFAFGLHNIQQKELTRVENSPAYLAKQAELATIESKIAATKQYETVDVNGLKGKIEANKTLISQLKDKRCPDTKCLEEKREISRQAAVDNDLFQAQVNGALDYQAASKAKIAALASMPTITSVDAGTDSFFASIADQWGVKPENGRRIFAGGWATAIMVMFLLCAYYTAVVGELATHAGIVDDTNRARRRKEQAIIQQELNQELPSLPAPIDSQFESNKEVSTEYFSLRQEATDNKLTKLRTPLSFNLGEQIIDFENAHHNICAGTTGEGKSSSLRSMLTQVISKNEPSNLEIVAIDLKEGVELTFLNKIPHVIKPVAETVDDANKLIEFVYNEMKLRYKIIKENEVEKIQNLSSKIPFLILIIDEGSKLKDSMAVLDEIAAQGRAAGIHLWFSTQYPLKADFGSTFMENIPVRICHYLQSSKASQAVLGSAEKGLNAHELPASGFAIYQAKRTRKQIKVNEVSFNDFKDFINQQAFKYSKQPATQPEPQPKKVSVVNPMPQTVFTPPKVAFATLQPIQPATVARQIGAFGDNVVQFPHKDATNATCNLTVAFDGNAALKNEENQECCNATDLQPTQVATPIVQPDKTQQNQQGRNATTLATTSVASLQPVTTFTVPPDLNATLRDWVEWAEKELRLQGEDLSKFGNVEMVKYLALFGKKTDRTNVWKVRNKGE